MDVAVFVVDGVGDLGLAAVLEVFNTANSLTGESESASEPWRVHTVALGTSVRSGHGHLIPTVPLDRMPDDIGPIIVPAVLAMDADAVVDLIAAPTNRPVLDRIAAAHSAGTPLAAACSGTFFLAEAGVLDGVPATTSWWLSPAFRRRYPRVDLDEGRILCRAGRIATAAAALAHVDLALATVATHSPAQAELAARLLLAGHGGEQREYIVPRVIARGNSLVAAFERWVREHIAEQFRITDAARELGVTVRSLQRATQSEIGMSPRDFVNEIRLERATRLLRSTDATVETIAARVGYLNAGTLRSLFRRRRGRSIAEVRASALAWQDRALAQ
ncbi:GlxA family transcriptional regulator [Nocardia veterana]|uniref:Helix-turn-helix domain-containing protein n=1 Tax=Nocardia veterana TaxID=132249 RepID=A0A7X6M241_9NOCA|nr:helix-turn-helix domain-containing protein [Nocardia veterana]NKY88796.1 helix-turn-helix domain-containing protein [Nocardia veterana]